LRTGRLLLAGLDILEAELLADGIVGLAINLDIGIDEATQPPLKSPIRRDPRVDTRYLRTYTVFVMNVTLSVDEQLVARARKRADALGKSLNQLIRDYLQKLAGGDDPDRSIEEFRALSGRGHSRGWRFNRDEIHERP
jgi:uncharacterized protein DUF6364